MQNFTFKLIEATLIPIKLFSFGAGIIGGIWLLFLGAWKIVGLGILLSMVFPYAYSIAMLVIMPFTYLGTRSIEKNRFLLGKSFAWIGMFIQHSANLIWVVLVLSPVFNLSVSGMLIPYILFAWFVAVSPFQYMAQHEPSDAIGTFVGLYLIQISYFVLVLFYFLGISFLAIPLCMVMIIFAEVVLLKSIKPSHI